MRSTTSRILGTISLVLAACATPHPCVERGPTLVLEVPPGELPQLDADQRVAVTVRETATGRELRRTVYVQRGATADSVAGALVVAFEHAGIGLRTSPRSAALVQEVDVPVGYEVVAVDVSRVDGIEDGRLEVRVVNSSGMR